MIAFVDGITAAATHITGVGKSGVWTKADSTTLFDDFNAGAARSRFANRSEICSQLLFGVDHSLHKHFCFGRLKFLGI